MTDYAHHLQGRRAAVALAHLRPAPHRLVERRRLPGPVAGQQQQGEQLRPAVGGGGGDPQDRGSPARPGDRPTGRRDDLPGRREARSPAACGSGSRPRPTRSTPTTCGPSPPAGRPAIGPRPPWPASTEVPRKALHAVYEALVAAADFFALRNQHKARLRLSRRRQRCTGPTRRSFTASTNSTGTSARPPTRPRRRAGTSSSRCGPTSRRATSTGI